MSSVGPSELFLLVIIGLLILGPERLPRVASQLGRWVGRARRTANQLRYQLEREIAEAEREQTPKPKPKPELPDRAATERIVADSSPDRSEAGGGGEGAPSAAAGATGQTKESTPG